MASPSLVSQTFSQSAGVTDTAFTPTLSAHTTGDMLELDVGLDGNPTVSFATGGQNGWTLHWQLKNTQGSTTPVHAKLTKRATSASETPPDLESDVGEAWGASIRVYRGAGGTLNYYTPTPVDGTDSGSSTNGQGSAVSPGAGSQDFTFTSCIVQDGVQGATAGPSGYGNFQTNANATASRVEVSTSEKAATASSDTPGAWTSAAEQWIVGGGAVWEDAGGATNYTLTCDVGAYTLTGVAAALRRGYSMVAATGAYSLTGQAATVSRGYHVTCDAGAYTLTGYDATLNYVPGAANYSLTCDTGAYSLTGHDATLTYSAGTANYTLTCDTGAYALTGNAAVTSFGRRMVADVGSYSLTGIAATISRGYSLTAQTGAYALTGYDADLIYTTTGPTDYTLVCETGAYVLSGGDASFAYSGEAMTPMAHGPDYTAHRKWWLAHLKKLEEEEKEIEPEAAEIIEAKAVQTVDLGLRAAPKDVKRRMESVGIAYREAYREVYLELVREIRQARAEEEEEEEAIAMALLL